MLQLPDDRRPPITPQLALRVAILGGAALTMFAIIFFRLWYLQVLSGDKYVAQAQNNQIRDVVVPAPRGDILNRNGRVLVDNRVSIAVQAQVEKLPPLHTPARRVLMRRLRFLLGVTPAKMERDIRQPHQGRQLKLSLDLGLERAGQNAMAEAGGIPIVNGEKNRGGAFVALDPTDGELLGMGSYPSFDPNIFAKPLKESTFKKLNSENTGAPLINRAIQSGYPTGSTFKLITALAALSTGTITPDTVIDDPGSVQIGNIVFHNSGNTAHGSLALRQALQVSSDVFFYKLGASLAGLRGDPLQTWAHRLGLGRHTGVDLPDEVSGLIPSPDGRNALFRKR